MSTAGTISSLGGGAAAPDPDRVASIRAAIVEDAEAAANFASSPAATLNALIDRAAGVTDGAPHAEAATLLALARDAVTGLDPTRLEPRRGLAGLFDSRGRRLKAFRATFVAVRDTAGSISADLMERAGVIGRRQAEQDALWTEIRDAIADLDAYIAAGQAWLDDRASPSGGASAVPPEAAAAFEDTPEADGDRPVEAQADAEASGAAPEPEATSRDGRDDDGAAMTGDATEPPQEPLEPTAAIVSLPHPLEGRVARLLALRASAVARLPLIRATQNADHAVPAALQSVRDQIEAWTADWREALGLNGKRPRKVRPDRARLVESRDALTASLSAAERAADAARDRLAELRPRTIVVAPDDRAAA